MAQASIDSANAAFWNEMCGTQAAIDLGVTGNDRASLKRFDDWFFGFYPYLDRYIDFAGVRGKDVLEVGLGYGSVSQRLAEHGARLTALDIAAGPVAGVTHRLAQAGLPGRAVQGSVLRAPFPEASFDVVVAIGCFHHTGNLDQALSEAHRVLRPGGRATIMVYNATSYLRWIRSPGRTWRYARSVTSGDPPPLPLDQGRDRGDFDRNKSGTAAPETVVVSKRHFERMLARRFSRVDVERANAAGLGPLRAIPRPVFLTLLGRRFGLDLYARVVK